MGISDILSEKLVLANVIADSKRGLLEMLSEFAADKVSADSGEIFEAIWERENLGSTGYGEGVAFPHARINGLEQTLAVVASLSQPVDFDSLDGKPVDVVAFTISPENSGDDHLKVLATLSRILKNEEICATIRKSGSAHEIYKALQK